MEGELRIEPEHRTPAEFPARNRPGDVREVPQDGSSPPDLP